MYAADPVGDSALVAGRARHRGELREERDDLVLRHAAILGAGSYALVAAGMA